MYHYDKEKKAKSQSEPTPKSSSDLPLHQSEQLIVWKKRGETLAELLVRVRAEHTIGESEKLTYAGRLDPLASGIVLILRGGELLKKDDYLSLPKSYTVTILLGISTDSYDPLGIVTNVSLSNVAPQKIEHAVRAIASIKSLAYPMYSSRTVAGKPLFMYARTNTDVVVPSKDVKIFESKLISIEEIPLGTTVSDIVRDIMRVSGDFRQDESVASWKHVLIENQDAIVTMVRVSISASSGTYMRSLAVWMGDKLGVPALAYEIIRTKIGTFSLD